MAFTPEGHQYCQTGKKLRRAWQPARQQADGLILKRIPHLHHDSAADLRRRIQVVI